MTAFYLLGPEVAGGLGEHSCLVHDRWPPRVEHLHCEFAGWLGDDLLRTFPCFIVTAARGERLTRLGATGFALRDVEVSTSPEFTELQPDLALPPFRWLDVHGTTERDDLGLTDRARLVVSERVLARLREGHLSQCEVAKLDDRE